MGDGSFVEDSLSARAVAAERLVRTSPSTRYHSNTCHGSLTPSFATVSSSKSSQTASDTAVAVKKLGCNCRSRPPRHQFRPEPIRNGGQSQRIDATFGSRSLVSLTQHGSHRNQTHSSTPSWPSRKSPQLKFQRRSQFVNQGREKASPMFHERISSDFH